MISLKENPNAPLGIDISNQESGCCGTVLAPSKYIFQFNSTPTSFTVLTVAGVAYAMVHTYSSVDALAAAIRTTLTTPLALGGVGAHVEEGDIKVFLNPYATTANALTVELVSGLVITNIISNLGTATPLATLASPKTLCEQFTQYTLSGAIEIVFNNTGTTLTTYATAALLRTALIAQITAAGFQTKIKVMVKTSATAGKADVMFLAVPGQKIYHDGNLLTSQNCNYDFLT